MRSSFVYPVLLCALFAGCTQNPTVPQKEQRGEPQGLSPCLTDGSNPPPGIIVGFGQGSSLAEARQRAYAHISEQLSVQVIAESGATTIKRNADLQSEFQQSVRSHSAAKLSDLQLQCLDQHSKPGQVYLTYRYDQRALAIKLTDRLVGTLGHTPAQIQWKGVPAIAASPLLTRVNRELARRDGTGTLATPVDLFWQSEEGKWLLHLGDLPISLAPAELQVAVDWNRLARGEAALAPLALNGSLQKRQIAAETEYRLVLKAPSGGYGHLVGIFENGTLDLVRSNLELAPDQAFIVPESGGVFEAALLDGKGTTDTFLLLVTRQPLRAVDLPSLNRRSDSAQLQAFLEELGQLEGDISIEQLVIE